MSTAPDNTTAIRLLDGLTRIGLALRQNGWSVALQHGLSPTQAQILGLLSNRLPGALSVTEIADELALSKPTISDSISALLRKNLISKTRNESDARSLLIALTERGAEIATAISQWSPSLLATTSQMTPAEQATFLRCLAKMIHVLQDQGVIPVSRMCINCRFFRPHQYPDPGKPHHCDFVNAPFGDAFIQIDCKSHQQAPADRRLEVWDAFLAADPTPQSPAPGDPA